MKENIQSFVDQAFLDLVYNEAIRTMQSDHNINSTVRKLVSKAIEQVMAELPKDRNQPGF